MSPVTLLDGYFPLYENSDVQARQPQRLRSTAVYAEAILRATSNKPPSLNDMSHRNLALCSLGSLEQLMETVFSDEAVRSSPRLVEVTSNAVFFLGQARQELHGLVADYDDLKAKLFAISEDEKA